MGSKVEKTNGEKLKSDVDFFELINTLPDKIKGYELNITKKYDEWVLCYETPFGILKDKNNRFNECILSDESFEVLIGRAVSWLQNYT